MATQKSGIARGLNKGHKVTARTPAAKPSQRKGAISERSKFVRSLVQEVYGLAPYERRAIELLRNGQDKRCRKMLKKKIGDFRRAKNKVEIMQAIIQESRRH